MASSGRTEVLSDAQLDQFEKELRDFKEDLTTWAEMQAATQQEAVRQDSATVRTTQDKLKELRQLEEEFLADEQRLLRKQEQQQDEMDRQCEDIALLGQTKAAILPQLKQAEGAVASLEADVREESEALKDVEAVRQQRIDALLSAVSKFREAFGLRFDPTPEGLLRLTFTKIDFLMPERQFIAMLDMGGDRDKGIKVLSSDPTVPGLVGAVQAAASEGDMRRLFKEIYLQFTTALAEGKC